MNYKTHINCKYLYYLFIKDIFERFPTTGIGTAINQGVKPLGGKNNRVGMPYHFQFYEGVQAPPTPNHPPTVLH